MGQAVAEKLVVLRSQDGADQKGEYLAEKRAGIWRPTPPAFAPALLPYWGTVIPFVIKRADQFKVADPLPLNSDAYVKELNEVKRLGGRNSTVRTADQTAAASWSPAPPAVIWNAAARAAATAKGNSLLENARLFALLNLAGVDAYIAGYDVKYKHKLWRPVTAIEMRTRSAILRLPLIQLGNRSLSRQPIQTIFLGIVSQRVQQRECCKAFLVAMR